MNNFSINTNANDTVGNYPPTNDSITPYNERVVIVLAYFGISLLIGIPVLMCLLCIYRMRGSAPCNVREACCNCC